MEVPSNRDLHGPMPDIARCRLVRGSAKINILIGLFCVFVLSLIGPPIAFGAEVTVVLDFPAEDVSLRAAADGTVVKLRDGVLPEDVPGTPWLPGRFVTVLVPSGAQIQRVDVSGDEILCQQDIDVVPVQTAQVRSRPSAASA